MTPKKFGWADDIVAPRQEINTLSLLYEQDAIQKSLPEDLTPKRFLQAYKTARETYRDNTHLGSPNSEDTTDLTQRVAVFGAKAGARARREPGERWMLSCVGPDRPGVLASLADMIAGEGGNIEGAVMSIVAGHLVTVFFVSMAERETPNLVVDGQPDLIAAHTRMEPADADWPRPGSTWWHVRARGRADTSLLLSLSGALAERKLPLVTMSSWREPASTSSKEEVEIVDLNFAMAPDPKENELHTIRAVESEVKKEVTDAQIDVLPARWSTQHRSEGEVGETKARDLVTTVVGHAEPGFVNTVITTLMEDVSGLVDIRGSSMVILDGMTVLTVVSRRAKKTAVGDLTSHIKKQVPHNLRTSPRGATHAPIQVVTIGPSTRKSKGGKAADDIHKSTHELNLEVPEQSRVVMKVAGLLADFKVNITWFVSHVREPTVGERWPICDIQMLLNVKPKTEDKVDAELRSLAEREGWEGIRLDKWSVRHR